MMWIAFVIVIVALALIGVMLRQMQKSLKGIEDRVAEVHQRTGSMVHGIEELFTEVQRVNKNVTSSK